MNTLIKFKRFGIALLFILGLAGIYYTVALSTPPKTEIQLTDSRESIRSIVPGQTTRQELDSIVGQPLKSDEKILEYSSPSFYRNHSVQVEDNRVELVKEIVTVEDEINSLYITDRYGNSPYTLYNTPEYRNNFYLFVYPQQGIAYIGHAVDTTVLEIWYFPQTNVENFQEQYAPDFTFEPEEIIHD